MVRKVTITRKGDYYVIKGGHAGSVSVMSKKEAHEIAAARRRVIKKRKAKVKSDWWF